jgi:hypothetical protein
VPRRRDVLLGVISAGTVAAGCNERRADSSGGESPSDEPVSTETHHGASTGESVELVVGGEAQFDPTVVDEAVPSAASKEFIHYAETSTNVEFSGEAAHSLRFEVDSFENVREAVREEAFELTLSGRDLVVRGGAHGECSTECMNCLNVRSGSDGWHLALMGR